MENPQSQERLRTARSRYIRDEWVKGIGLPTAFLIIAIKVLVAGDPIGYVTSEPFVAGAAATILAAPLVAYAMGRIVWWLGFGREGLDDDS